MDKKKASLSNGIHITYLERPGSGDGAPLVLLHGITDNANTYLPFFADLAPTSTVYALDFRGHGDSDRSKALYNTEAYADDVRCFINEVIGEPVLLAGHSLGGLVTTQVAVTAPSLVRRILLEDPPLYFVGNLDDIYQALFEGVVVMARTLQDGTRSERDWFDVMAAAPDPYSGKPGIETMGAEKINDRLYSIGKMDPKAMEDGLANSLVWDADEVLAKVQCPVTLLTGNRVLGAVITEAEAKRTSEITGATLQHFPNVGHLIHGMEPEGWLAAVNGWVGE